MNINTIAGLIGGTGVNQIASQTLASTDETAFVVQTGASPTTATAVLRPPLRATIQGVRTPFSRAFNAASTIRTGGRFNPQNICVEDLDNGVPFGVRVCGLATPASNAGNTLEIKLYIGTSISGTNIATTGAVAQASTTTAKPFIVEAQCVWDSTSRSVIGQFWFSLPGTGSTVYATWATLSNAGSSVDADDLVFCASADWGNAVGGVVAVSELSMYTL